MKSTDYSAGLMSQSSWFLELKKLVQLRKQGVEAEEIKRRCLEDNLFGMATENRVKRAYGYLIKRLDSMDDTLVDLFCSSDLSTQKLINLITVLNEDRLFFEFVNEVYREKIILGYQVIETSDANTFFRDKATDSEDLQKWKDTTIKKLKCCYFNFMEDANLLYKDKSKHIITPPIVDIALERYMQYNNLEHILKAITGVR